MSRNGKVARLPREIRDELNRRLDDGQTAVSLVRWLNELPEVQAIVAREFGGYALTEQNLSEWRTGGFVEWQACREMLEQTHELTADGKELSGVAQDSLTDHLSTVLAARYAVALARWNGEADEGFQKKLRALYGLSHHVAELRRGDHGRAWIRLEQDRLDHEREQTEQEVVAQFEAWSQNPKVLKSLCSKWENPEARVRRIREMFAPKSVGAAPAGGSATEGSPAEQETHRPAS